MPQSLYSFPSRTNPQTTLKSKDFAFSPTPTNKSMHKSTTFDSNDKAEFSPVEIGTRDTVASLIMQDVEYFNKIGSNSYRNMSQIPKLNGFICPTPSTPPTSDSPTRTCGSNPVMVFDFTLGSSSSSLIVKILLYPHRAVPHEAPQ
ncbi:hypothetical protein GmHk_18G052509 [Glycine max]|nr:hypothetical protein GmHk_18G052509 [Glycine max]